jgi:uncharacterized oxidoreductase
MADRSRDRLEREAAKLNNAVVIAVDLTNENDLNKLIQTIKLNYSELNIVILNAGAANDYSLYSTDYDLEYAKLEINTNYIANVRLTHALEPLLSAKEEAAFVVTTSGLAFVPNLNYPTYSATKAASHSFALASRLALKRKGSRIKFFDLMPPLTDTPLAKGLDAPKITAAEVAAWFINSFEKDELEIHVGGTEKIYQLFLKSPEEALMAVNGWK